MGGIWWELLGVGGSRWEWVGVGGSGWEWVGAQFSNTLYLCVRNEKGTSYKLNEKFALLMAFLSFE